MIFWHALLAVPEVRVVMEGTGDLLLKVCRHSSAFGSFFEILLHRRNRDAEPLPGPSVYRKVSRSSGLVKQARRLSGIVGTSNQFPRFRFFALPRWFLQGMRLLKRNQMALRESHKGNLWIAIRSDRAEAIVFTPFLAESNCRGRLVKHLRFRAIDRGYTSLR